MKPVIREMIFDDLDQVLEIEKQVFADPWSRRSYEFEIYINKFSIPVVMELDNKIIGYMIAWSLFEEFHIANVAVHPDFQGKGLGKYLLMEMLKRAEDKDYAMLEVRPSNQKAIHLYETLGFEKVGIRRRYYLNGEDAVIMKKELKRVEVPRTRG